MSVRLTSLGSPAALRIRPTGELKLIETGTGDPLHWTQPVLAITARGDRLMFAGRESAGLRVEAERLTLGIERIERVYPGALLITAASGALQVRNECDLEDYVTGALAAECPALFHSEAIRAVAVAIRSYAYRKALVIGGELCDTTHCQVYNGIGRAAASIRQAVRDTAGMVASHDGGVIDGVFSADCGGYTEANEEAWPGTKPVPYLRPVEDAPEPHGDPYCSVNRTHAWRVALGPERLRTLYGRDASDLKLQILERSESGRARRVEIAPAGPDGCGEAPRKSFTGAQLRRLLGTATLKSLRFDVRDSGKGCELPGTGWGHGVGLCQYGANGMARAGIPWDEILRHYYSGIEIGPLK